MPQVVWGAIALVAAASCLAAGAPWFLTAVVMLPALMWAPGSGWARRRAPHPPLRRRRRPRREGPSPRQRESSPRECRNKH